MSQPRWKKCLKCGIVSRDAAVCPSCNAAELEPATRAPGKPGEVAPAVPQRSIRRPPRPAASATAERTIYQRRVHHGRSMTTVSLDTRSGRVIDGLLLLLAMHAMQLLWLFVKPSMIWFIWATQFTYVLPASVFMIAMRRWRTLAGIWLGALLTVLLGLLAISLFGPSGG